jgi:hypothetical protein
MNLWETSAQERRVWDAADSTAEAMVRAGAVTALLGLLATSSDAGVLGSTVYALAVLSTCGASTRLFHRVCFTVSPSQCLSNSVSGSLSLTVSSAST